MQEHNSRSKLSVIVCTHDRASYASDCAEALLRCPGAQSVEVIVVDNASSEQERRLLESRLRHQRICLIEEATPGLSRARNVGAGFARSEWIGYLDDDALPFSDWIENALALISDPVAQNCGMIGGVVLPQWPENGVADGIDPAHLGSRWRTLLSLVDAERFAPGSGIPEVVGCNMLVRRSILTQIGGFPTNLGRTPERQLGGEEIEVARKVHACGYRVKFEPKLGVYHRIHPERLMTTWIRRRAQAEGELLWMCSPTPTKTVKILLSIPYLAFASRLRALRTGLPSDYDHHVRLWNNLGYLKSALNSVAERARI